jgi:hypothetical protein
MLKNLVEMEKKDSFGIARRELKIVIVKLNII